MNTIIEKIRAEIERLQHTDIPHIDEWWAGADYVRRRMKEVLSDLEKEEKPIEGLDEEIDKRWKEWLSDDKEQVEGVLPKSEFAFYARHFAQWQKEQMMKEAVEGETCPLKSSMEILIPNLTNNTYKVGDKVKLIIVKED